MIKRILLILLVLVLSFSVVLAGSGGPGDDGEEESDRSSGAEYREGEGADIETREGQREGTEQADKDTWALTMDTRTIYEARDVDGETVLGTKEGPDINWYKGIDDYFHREWDIDLALLPGMDLDRDELLADGHDEIQIWVHVEIEARPPGGSYSWYRLSDDEDWYNLTQTEGSWFIENYVNEAALNLGEEGRGYAYYTLDLEAEEEKELNPNLLIENISTSYQNGEALLDFDIKFEDEEDTVLDKEEITIDWETSDGYEGSESYIVEDLQAGESQSFNYSTDIEQLEYDREWFGEIEANPDSDHLDIYIGDELQTKEEEESPTIEEFHLLIDGDTPEFTEECSVSGTDESRDWERVWTVRTCDSRDEDGSCEDWSRDTRSESGTVSTTRSADISYTDLRLKSDLWVDADNPQSYAGDNLPNEVAKDLQGNEITNPTFDYGVNNKLLRSIAAGHGVQLQGDIVIEADVETFDNYSEQPFRNLVDQVIDDLKVAGVDVDNHQGSRTQDATTDGNYNIQTDNLGYREYGNSRGTEVEIYEQEHYVEIPITVDYATGNMQGYPDGEFEVPYEQYFYPIFNTQNNVYGNRFEAETNWERLFSGGETTVCPSPTEDFVLYGTMHDYVGVN